METSFGRGIVLGIVMVMTDFGSVYLSALVSLRWARWPSYLIVRGFISESMDVGGLGHIGGDEVGSVEVEENAVLRQVVGSILTSDARDVMMSVGFVMANKEGVLVEINVPDAGDVTTMVFSYV